jgi:hypothetical protein
MDTYASTAILSVAHAKPDVRATFIRKTYTHLAGAIGLFVLLEMALLQSPFAPAMMKLLGGSLPGAICFSGYNVLVCTENSDEPQQTIGTAKR